MTSVHPPEIRERTLAKARVLLEALPYIREHRGRAVVVKVGGAALEQAPLARSFAEDVALLRLAGVRPVVVHGGGPQISAISERLGVTPRFIRGLRVTDAETLTVARMVLAGVINKDLVGLINAQGVPAVGVSGEDARLLEGAPKGSRDGVDLGFVGEVARVNTRLLTALMEEFVPVVASIASDGEGQPYNVNADEAAAAVAVSLTAEKLVYLTDVPGLWEEVGGDAQLLSEVSVGECRRLLASGAVTSGMIPKVESALVAMAGGVRKTHILDGRVEHALLLELFTPEGLGTMVSPDGPAAGPAPAGGDGGTP